MRELSGMQQEHREALRSSHLLLAKQLVPGEVCQHLLAQRVLTEEMLELIEAKSGPFSRNVELLRLLPKRGPCAFDAFCRALRDTEQGHLVALLHQHLTPGPDVTSSQTPRTLEAAPGDGEREGASPPKKPRRSDTAESSLDDGDGPLSCSVLPCSAEFYQRHRETSYRMDSRPKGLAMIISNVRFGDAQELVDRQGGEVDHWALEKLLTSLGFSVRSLHDRTAEVMKSELLQFARLPDHRSNHSCVVALLSHGVEGAVYGTDGKLLQLQDVFRLFDNDSCPQLQNKPKIFFIQACRGEETDCGVDLQDGKDRCLSPGCEQSDAGREETLRMKLPTRSDIICGYACLKGMAALRNTRRGTWYVQALTQVLAAHAKDTHLADMLVKVNSLIKEREGFCPGTAYHRCKEMSEYSSTLCKDLYLFPGIYQP